MSLQYNGFEVSAVTCTTLTGQPALGGHVLAFFLTFQPKQIPQSAMSNTQASQLRDFRLRVNVSAGKQGLLLGTAGCIEQAFLRLDTYAHQDTKRFEFVLTEGQLAAVEAARGTGGVSFALELFATSDGNLGQWYTKSDLTVERSLSEWTKLLADMGASEYFCVPVAIPRVGLDDEHAPAVKWLRSAQKFMLQGEFATAIGECRHALECLSEVTERAAQAGGFDELLSEKQVLRSYQSERRKMTRGQRLVLSRMAVYHLTNISHHQAAHPEQTLSREDANLVLASTAALLSASMAQRFHPAEDVLQREEPGDN